MAVAERPKLTIKSATEQWAETTRAIEGLKVVQADAAKFLLAHAERTGRRTYGDLIAVTATGGQRTLNRAEVEAELGDLLSEERFWKRAKRGLSLKLLK